MKRGTKKAPCGDALVAQQFWIPEQGPARPNHGRKARLRHLSWLHAILPLNVFHLIFEPQLEFLEADFLDLFVIRQETFFGELFESLGVLGVFHG
jgi:hypothetical protein